MAPVPAPKKTWVFDGTIEQYPDDYLATAHGTMRDCVDCHGGNDKADTRDLAHDMGWVARPSGELCETCHSDEYEHAAGGLHATLGGYITILEGRGVDLTEGSTAHTRFNQKCADCHIANADQTESRCGHCHVSVPSVAGAGFINGHNFRKTPDMERQCTACHGSRVKAEFFGLNGDLTGRNGLGVAVAGPDVHLPLTRELNDDGYEKGCTFCHGANEMHGFGAPDVGLGDRYNVAGTPQCYDCHNPMDDPDFGTAPAHTEGHLAAMNCQSCHAQAYKQCFSCHVDFDGDTNHAYFAVNENDPTLGGRPEGSAPDALMTFRLGRSPREDKLNPITNEPYGYAILRHVPIDRDLFRYSNYDPIDGLVPNMTDLPTWKYATVHNVQRVGYVPYACSNCHGAEHSQYWLTDVLLNSEGWVAGDYEGDEVDANVDVVVPDPVPYGAP